MVFHEGHHHVGSKELAALAGNAPFDGLTAVGKHDPGTVSMPDQAYELTTEEAVNAGLISPMTLQPRQEGDTK
jgi:hypothetical protein